MIGIVCRSEYSDGRNIFFVNEKVVRWINRNGEDSFLLMPPNDYSYGDTRPREIPKLTSEDKKRIDKMISYCDGIIIPGGSKWYEFDEYIARYCIDNDIPLLGICCGMQLMAKVLNNEKNIVDTNIRNENNIHSGHVNYAHDVIINKDSFLYEIIGKERIKVNSVHNYHIAPEFSFLASSYSEDGLIEAIEYRDNKFTLGVQWHPEALDDENSKKLVKRFIESTKL